MEAIVWLVILVALLVIELCTVGLTTIWFAGGALVALILNLLGVNVVIQIIACVAVSVALLVFTRPLVKKYISSKHIKTNYEGIIGKVVRITERVNNLDATGAAMVNGQEWTVRTDEDGVTLEAGTIAKVVNISGVKLIVREYTEM